MNAGILSVTLDSRSAGDPAGIYNKVQQRKKLVQKHGELTGVGVGTIAHHQTDCDGIALLNVEEQ